MVTEVIHVGDYYMIEHIYNCAFVGLSCKQTFFNAHTQNIKNYLHKLYFQTLSNSTVYLH
jgi:hypothetical protein